MKSLTITYRPLSFIPFSRTITREYPQNWGEISPEQLIAIGCLYKAAISDINFLKTMLRIPKFILKRTTDYDKFKLMEQLEFVGDRRPFHEFIIPKLQTNGLTLSKPLPKLKGVTFGQFIFADTYFSNYLETNDDDNLNKFVAALYLGKDEKFDESIIGSRSTQIANTDKIIREAIVLNYQLIREWLALAYPLIFQKHDEAETADVDQLSKTSGNGWIQIFQNFVGDDILHDDQWAAKPINTILTFMTRKQKENARKH